MPHKLGIYAPEHFLNRELNWLEFNQRVLEESQDPGNPLLERVKFLCIASSNLDEFFEIRVAGIKQQIENKSSDAGPDGLNAVDAFSSIHQRVSRMVRDQYLLWKEELLPDLAKNDIHFHNLQELTASEKKWIEEYFISEIYPVLTPLAIDPSHPFPQLLNKSLNIIVMLEKPDMEGETRHAIVQVPRVLNRLISLPPRSEKSRDFIFLSAVIEGFAQSLFPGVNVLGAYAFRVTRNSDLYIDEEEAQNLLRSIEEELRKRNRGNAVRLELEKKCPPVVQSFLLQKFKLQQEDLYLVDEPLNLLRLMPLTESEGLAGLKYKPFTPAIAPLLQSETDIFEIIRHQDVLLHHPYHNFSSIVEFLETAAADPTVLAIKMTLYRTSGDSPIVKALIRAANNGKQVTVMVELKARFDEANNIAWARRMEDAGCHVVYGLVGLKTHCKLLFIVRRDADKIRHYVHLGTGNYHSRTARLYSDLGLLTTQEEITNDVATLFNALTGMSDYRGSKKLIVAPFNMKERFRELIEREIAHARAGRPGRIFAKINSLAEPEIITLLYDASTAGVKIELLVRGICCLRPGLPGVSENIEVRSIVDQYLEHSRIFYFENDGQYEIYLGSADWMSRNLRRRVEVVFPVEDPKLKQHLVDNVIHSYWKDNQKSRRILPDGSHVRIAVGKGQHHFRAQEFFMRAAEKEKAVVEPLVLNKPVEFIPIEHPPDEEDI
ncbi:MAG: polyphosphate kinase 1 [Methylacidiphilales bacterium]|nr:polyphosphate kinase 1 [Candidatus Methylacidiphilales bacterium]